MIHVLYHAVVGILYVGSWGGSQVIREKDMQFLDYVPKSTPSVCWERGVVDAGNETYFYVCVDKKKHIVYEGRLLPMLDT